MSTPHHSPPRSASSPYSWRAVALVFVGGALGVLVSTVVRLGLTPYISTPLALALENIAGAFALGALVGLIPDGGRDARVLWGTGFLGGFTSFSAIAATVWPIQSIFLSVLENDPSEATDYEGLLMFEMPLFSIPLAVFSLVAGMILAWAGLRLASRRRPTSSRQLRAEQHVHLSQRAGEPHDQGHRGGNHGI